MTDLNKIDKELEKELQAEAFKFLIKHFQERTDVQNIDLMNLAGFCRNCLSRWIQDAGSKHGLIITKEQARKYVYGMEYSEWQKLYQIEANEEKLNQFKEKNQKHKS